MDCNTQKYNHSPKFWDPSKVSESKNVAAGTHRLFFFFWKLRCTHRSYFRNYVCYIVSIFALAEIIQNIKVYICLNREFCHFSKKKKKKKKKILISIGHVVFGVEIKIDIGRWICAYAWHITGLGQGLGYLITGLGYLKNYVSSFWIAVHKSTIIPLKDITYPRFPSRKEETHEHINFFFFGGGGGESFDAHTDRISEIMFAILCQYLR